MKRKGKDKINKIICLGNKISKDEPDKFIDIEDYMDDLSNNKNKK